jgi:hypothetical protein
MVVLMSTRGGSTSQRALIIIVAVGLIVDAFVHIHLAPDFKHVKTSTMSQADLFYLEAVAAVIAAILLVVRPRRSTAGFAFLVAAAGTVAVVVYRYVNVGAFGPVPNMYDPYWAPALKALSAIAEAIAAAAALTLFLQLRSQARQGTGDTAATRVRA